jgi:hypothetical protein
MPLTRRHVTLLIVLASLMTTGCAGHLPPPPPVLATPGVRSGADAFRQERIASLPDRIMTISRDGDRLMIVSELGVWWVDDEGRTAAEARFPQPLFRPVVVPRGRDGAAVVGFSKPKYVRAFDVRGTPLLELKGKSYKLPLVGNVLGDGEAEVLVPDGDGFRIVGFDGTDRGDVKAPWYASDRTLVQADDDPALEIAFVKTHLGGRQGVQVRVVNADGSPAGAWDSAEGNWLSWEPALGERLLWGVTPQGFAAWNALGVLRETYPAPGVDYLRYVAGARSPDHLLLAASGGGYTGIGTICIYSREGALVYQEVYDARSYAVFHDARTGAFYVGAGADLIRYRPVSTAGGAR